MRLLFEGGVSSRIGSLSNNVFERRTSTGSGLFWFFDGGFAQIFSQIASITVKKLRNTNFISSRHVKRENTSLPVDVRRSKTPLLKLPNIRYIILIDNLKVGMPKELLHTSGNGGRICPLPPGNDSSSKGYSHHPFDKTFHSRCSWKCYRYVYNASKSGKKKAHDGIFLPRVSLSNFLLFSLQTWLD